MKIRLKTVRKVALGILLVLVGGGLGYFWGTRKVSLAMSGARPVISVVNHLELQPDKVDFSQFWEVWDQLSRTYLDPAKMDAEAMVYGAISGMTASLGDPYTVFLPPDDNQKSKEDLNGEFGGVGIQLGYIDQTLAVMSPLENTPASRKGILAGDLILHLTDKDKELDIDTDGVSLTAAVDHIRGPVGTEITLTLYRQSRGSFEVTVTRETITVPSVELKIGRWQDGKFTLDPAGPYAWLKVYRFGENTDSQWDEGINQILRAKPNLTGVVLDLRNNPGGYVQSAIYMASEFVPDGVIVQQKGRYTTETYSVRRSGRLIGFPVVVLINKGSASASEIVAGALRDRVGAKLVGTTSFGKGTVQDAMDLRGSAGLHVTIARWLLPGGDWINETGIKPEVEIEMPELAAGESAEAMEDLQLKRALEEL